MKIRNFLFHRVSDEPDSFWPPMKPLLFETIVRYLKRRYSVVLLENALNQPSLLMGQKRPVATIQFDDGYKDNIERAVPILKKYDCPASFYVVTDCIDKGVPTWTYLLDHAIQYTRAPEIKLAFDFVSLHRRKIKLENAKDLRAEVQWIKPWLKKISNTKRIAVVESILNQCKDVTVPTASMMTWDDLIKLNKDGFYVGSHSKSHPLLASLEDENEIAAELKASATRIGEMTGQMPLTISYPVGSYDERVMRIAKECGYRYGLAVEQRFFNTERDSLVAIPRVELYQEQQWKAFARVTGLANTINKYVRRKI